MNFVISSPGDATKFCSRHYNFNDFISTRERRQNITCLSPSVDFLKSGNSNGQRNIDEFSLIINYMQRTTMKAWLCSYKQRSVVCEIPDVIINILHMTFPFQLIIHPMFSLRLLSLNLSMTAQHRSEGRGRWTRPWQERKVNDAATVTPHRFDFISIPPGSLSPVPLCSVEGTNFTHQTLFLWSPPSHTVQS